LFQRFFQSDRRPGSGAGLGLTIARRIALAHQGDLEISDNPGGGTRFTLTLPLKETVHIGI
jgi:signal transduction histidine kinase